MHGKASLPPARNEEESKIQESGVRIQQNSTNRAFDLCLLSSDQSFYFIRSAAHFFSLKLYSALAVRMYMLPPPIAGVA
jgi:hypothetical protein